MTNGKRRLTIADVAEAAGVARSSVSRAFSHPGMLKPDTVRRILDAADSLGYIPNPVARALSTGRHGNLALIVPDIANPFFPPLIRAVQLEAERFDFCVFLGSSDENPKQEDRLVGRFSSQVEGLILASSRLTDERIRAHSQERPVVLINRDVEGIPRVLIDSGVGVREAVAHLADLGHRRITYVSGPAKSWSNKQRLAAVRAASRKLHLSVKVVGTGVPRFEAGLECVDAVLASGSTAVIAFDDLIAQGILAGLARRAIRVPDAFCVVGCDDVLGTVTYPSLTTVSNRSMEAGKAALSLLMELLQRRAVRDIRYVLDTHLVIRDTTRGYAVSG